MRLPIVAGRRRSSGSVVRRLSFAGLAVAVATAGAVALANPAAAAESTGSIREAGTPTVVPDSYVVILKGGVSIQDAVSNVAVDYNAKVGHVFTHAVLGFEASMSEDDALRLAANSAVDYVQRNGIYTITDTQANPPSWGLDRIDQRNLPLNNSYTYPNAASNVHAYIVDTGIRFSHSTFGGRATSGFDAVDGGAADDCHGHGTHVSGTVGGSQYGVAKGVALVGVRVLDCNGSGTTAGVTAGIDWVTANAIKPAVANMSLGGGADTTLDTAVRNSIASGVTYGIAAGNGDIFGRPQNACSTSPARVAEAITVGATDRNDNKASFSNFGTCLDIFAPGVDITSSWKDNDTATNTISGTSMATPHVVGAAALVLGANPTFTPQQVRDSLVNSATSGKVVNPGSGSPNKLLFVDGGTPVTDDFSLSLSAASGSAAPGGSTSTTVSTAVTAGNAQAIALSATGLPAGATVTFDPASVTAGSSSTATIAIGADTAPGTYTVTVTGAGTAASHSATYSLTVTGTPSSACTGTNGDDVSIPDAGTAVTSTITIGSCDRAASSTATVEVHIKHTYRGDLRIDLVAPDGTTYRLKNNSGFDGADNVDATYTVDVSSEGANGAWQLRVQDVYRVDTGNIDTWTLTL